MNEKQTFTQSPRRPTKKQKTLLDFIETFINEHGYSPSYREIMLGLNYKSVATVALHVNSLIKRGHLRKRDHSARSLEPVALESPVKITTNQVAPAQEKWFVDKVEHAFKQVEDQANDLAESSLDHLYVLIGAMKILGMEGAAQSFMPRLTKLKARQTSV
jgi:SOS-response transcriptional repressor LexA